MLLLCILLCFSIAFADEEIPPPSSIVNSQGIEIYHSKSEKLRNGHQQNSYKKHEEKDYSPQDSADQNSNFQPKEEFSQILKSKDEASLSGESLIFPIPCLSKLMSFVFLFLHQIFVFYIS